MREELSKLLGRDPTYRECCAYLAWKKLTAKYPELLKITQS